MNFLPKAFCVLSGLLVSFTILAQELPFIYPKPFIHAKASSEVVVDSINHLGHKALIPAGDYDSLVQRVASYHGGSLSLFFVLKPLFMESKSLSFLSSKVFSLTDEGVWILGQKKVTSYKRHMGKVISIRLPNIKRDDLRKLALVDTSLFHIAEMIAYDEFLSDSQTRQIEVLLSLRYAIPTTEISKPEVRDYLSDMVDHSFWNAKADRLYRKEVLGLGQLYGQGYLQHQSSAYYTDSLIAALDTIILHQPLMHDSTFSYQGSIVLSKR
jgi:hypothetical protein